MSAIPSEYLTAVKTAVQRDYPHWAVSLYQGEVEEAAAHETAVLIAIDGYEIIEDDDDMSGATYARARLTLNLERPVGGTDTYFQGLTDASALLTYLRLTPFHPSAGLCEPIGVEFAEVEDVEGAYLTHRAVWVIEADAVLVLDSPQSETDVFGIDFDRIALSLTATTAGNRAATAAFPPEIAYIRLFADAGGVAPFDPDKRVRSFDYARNGQSHEMLLAFRVGGADAFAVRGVGAYDSGGALLAFASANIVHAAGIDREIRGAIAFTVYDAQSGIHDLRYERTELGGGMSRIALSWTPPIHWGNDADGGGSRGYDVETRRTRTADGMATGDDWASAAADQSAASYALTIGDDEIWEARVRANDAAGVVSDWTTIEIHGVERDGFLTLDRRFLTLDDRRLRLEDSE